MMKVVERRRKRLGSGPSRGGDYHHRDGEYHHRGGRGGTIQGGRILSQGEEVGQGGIVPQTTPRAGGGKTGPGTWEVEERRLVWDQPAPCLCGGLLTTKDKQTTHNNTKWTDTLVWDATLIAHNGQEIAI